MKKISIVTTVALVGWFAFYSINIFKQSVDAYLFGYPLVLMDATRLDMKNLYDGNSDNNEIHHLRELPNHEFRSVVRPNNDTLYSVVWFDLREQPQVIAAPDMGDNYYVLPFMDAWTNVFSTIGTRTTGNDAKQFVLVGPDWEEPIPETLHRINSPTNMVWMIARTEVKDLTEPQNVFDLQDQFRITDLGGWKKDQWKTPPLERSMLPADSDKLSPPQWVASLDANRFFSKFSGLLAQQYPTAKDLPALENLKNLGIVAGENFSVNPLKAWIMDHAIRIAHEKLVETSAHRQPNEDNWFVIRKGIGRYDQDYKTRAFVAMFGLGALPPEEASYPNTRHDSSQQVLSGKHRYRIHWNNNELPPVGAFWSLTIYDSAGYMIENSINRYRLGSNNELNWNADGSLNLQLQNAAPDTQDANWLPVPEGEFNMVLRMYWPDESFLQGQWQLPVIERLP